MLKPSRPHPKDIAEVELLPEALVAHRDRFQVFSIEGNRKGKSLGGEEEAIEKPRPEIAEQGGKIALEV